MANKKQGRLTTTTVPIYIENNPMQLIGSATFLTEKIGKITEDSVFSIGYIKKTTTGRRFELVDLSLTTDKKYKKYLDKNLKK